MSDIVTGALKGAINLADATVENALDVLGAAGDLAVGLATAPIRVGDATLDAVLNEARDVKARLVRLLGEAAEAIGAPLP